MTWNPSEKIVAIDFDGVIHKYISPWVSSDVVVDEPVDGIKDEIDKLRAAGYKVVVMSSRCLGDGGYDAIKNYLHQHNITVDDITSEKIGAHVYIDDRAMCFSGLAQGLYEAVVNFKPWQNRGN